MTPLDAGADTDDLVVIIAAFSRSRKIWDDNSRSAKSSSIPFTWMDGSCEESKEIFSLPLQIIVSSLLKPMNEPCTHARCPTKMEKIKKVKRQLCTLPLEVETPNGHLFGQMEMG